MSRPGRRVDALSRAIALQQQGDTLALKGNYWTAAILFEQAADYALTPEGMACLLAKATEARHQLQTRIRHAN